jgi:hypothetical protein
MVMGNWSPADDERRHKAVENLNARIAEIDARFPKIERPCGTPGAIYTVVVEGNTLGCTAELPFDIEKSLPADAKEKMKAALHDATLPIVEQFYRNVWQKTIAGKILADDPDPMPARWELLFSAWLLRCLQRGEAPTMDGHVIYSKHSLPEAYRPADFRWWP